MINDNFITSFIDEDIKNNRFSRPIKLRFPPEPNGFLHIGHAKAIFINFEIAKKYKGECNLRFDDTNPSKENDVFVEAIKKDLDYLGYKPNNVFFASDYFNYFYESAIKLIEKGLAYVDESTPEEIKEMRGTLTKAGVNSPFRDREITANLEIFKEMKEGEFNDRKFVLRAKIDMKSPNMNMRDPIIYRISTEKHHRTNEDWCIYPMYDFAHPLEDAYEGVTHSLCSLEFLDHRPLYDWVLNSLDIKEPPRQIEFARLNITNSILSKREIGSLIDEGKIDSFNDERLMTLSALKRRGVTSDAIKNFCQEIGVSRENSVIDLEYFDHFVREDLKEKVASKNVVFNPIKITIANYEDNKTEKLEIENSMSNPDLGKREILFSKNLYIDGEDFMEDPPKKYFRLFPKNEVRLKAAYFIKCDEVVKDSEGIVKELICTYDHLTKSGMNVERKVKGTIHFVEESSKKEIRIKLLSPILDEDKKYNDDSMEIITAYAEESISEVKKGETVQFFRKGYFTRDSFSDDEELVFIRTVDLKSSFKI